MEEKINNVDDTEKIEIDEDLEIVKDIKNNEMIVKEKINDVLRDLNKNDEIIKSRNRRKTVLYTIGVIIEIIIIILILKKNYL